MESPDVVDTSDVEEREAFALSEDADHWPSPVSTPMHNLRAGALTSPQSHATTEKGCQRCLSTLITRHDWFSDHEVENPSPRKRVKV
jgi:hypothetical protein